MADLAATFRKPFAEQVAAFRLRLGNLVPTARWDDLIRSQHDRAFMVAGATKADLLADLAAAVEKAVAEGTSLDEFRRDFRRIVEERGWHGWTGEDSDRGRAWRTRVIYRTNLATSYSAGRMAQLVEGGFAYWVYRHGGSREPRIVHLGWDGLVLPPDHEFWATHAPPNGWGCSCYIVGARSREGARRLGGDPDKPLPDNWRELNPRTGAPVGIDRGWDYAPGASAIDDILRAVERKRAELPARIAEGIEAETAARRAALEESAMRELLIRAAGGEANSIMDRARTLGEPLLNVSERAAIYFYTLEPFYKALNRNLREVAVGRGSMSSPEFRIARVIDRALVRLPRYEGTVVRGVRRVHAKLSAQIDRLAAGDVVQFRGFSSGAIDADAAFPGNLRFVIHSRSARRIDHLSGLPKEREALFGRGLQFRVLKRTFNRRVTVIELEELAPGEWTSSVKELMADAGMG